MQRWEIWLIKFTIYIAIFSGYTSLYIDFNKCILKTPKILQMFVTFSNLSILFFLPMASRLRKFIYFNIFLMFYHTNGFHTTQWTLMYTGYWKTFLNVFIAYCSINFQHLIMLHHASLICYMYEAFSQINYQINHEILDPTLGIIHYHLHALMSQLNVIFNPLNLWIQLSIFLSNSMVGYVTVTSISNGFFDLEFYSSILGSTLYYLLCLHMYVYFLLCEWVYQISRKTLYLMKNCCIKPHNQEIEKLSFNCVLLPVRISIYNMLNINLESFFTLMSETLLYIILLVQVDYSKLKKE
ncbi:uncharacterized protein ACRADG_009525 [Cochliomyia hominivorax]